MNNQEKHIKIKKTLKSVGLILLVVGLALDIIGFSSFFSSFGNFKFPKYFWCLFIGFPLTGLGIGLLSSGFKREIMTYSKNETVPIVNEAVTELKPAIKEVTESLSKIKDVDNYDAIICDCGEKNGLNDNYCRSCGKNLKKRCSFCGETVVTNSNFCNKCGKRL